MDETLFLPLTTVDTEFSSLINYLNEAKRIDALCLVFGLFTPSWVDMNNVKTGLMINNIMRNIIIILCNTLRFKLRTKAAKELQVIARRNFSIRANQTKST